MVAKKIYLSLESTDYFTTHPIRLELFERDNSTVVPFHSPQVECSTKCSAVFIKTRLFNNKKRFKKTLRPGINRCSQILNPPEFLAFCV